MVYRIRVRKDSAEVSIKKLLLPNMIFEMFCCNKVWYGDWYETKNYHVYYSNIYFGAKCTYKLLDDLIDLKNKK